MGWLRLFEYQAKELLARHGVPVPRGLLVNRAEDAEAAANTIGLPVVLKAQVRAGGRAKAGGVVKVEKMEMVRSAFDRAMRPISGEKPVGVLVEEFVPHDSEAYVSIALDRSRRGFVLILSLQGGVDVERLGEKVVTPLEGEPVSLEMAVGEALKAGFEEGYIQPVAKTIHLMSRLSMECEAELVEVNPLALVDGRVLALDAKIILDDNALFRHPELQAYQKLEGLEAEAQRYGFSFVPLEGDIIVVGNGAGLVMSSLDLVSDMGGKPGAFLDLGGGASAERVYAALRLADQLPWGRVIFINVFGGITRCSEVASAIKRLYDEGLLRKPIYARLSGSEEDEAKAILRPTRVALFTDPEEAARAAVLAVGSG